MLAKVVIDEEGKDPLKQLRHGLAAVVTCDIGMQVLPEALDAIVVGAIGRQEMQDDSAAELGDVALRDVARVDDVVVEDDVDVLRSRVVEQELVEQAAEEQAVLSLAVDPGELSSGRIEGASDIVLLILAGRDDHALLPVVHPVEANLRIEVDVDLVCVEDGLVLGRPGDEPYERCQDMLASSAWPGTEHDWLGISSSRIDVGQSSPHRAGSDQRKASMVHLQGEQLSGPGRTLPARILRCSIEDDSQLVEKCAAYLGSAVIDSSVVQAAQPTGEKAGGRSHDSGHGAAQPSRHLVSRMSSSQCGQNQVSERGTGVAGPSSGSNQLLPLCGAHMGYGSHQGSSIGSARLSNATFDRETFVFNFSSSVAYLRDDRQSRAVI